VWLFCKGANIVQVQRLPLRGVAAPKASRRVSACSEGADAPPPLCGGTPLRHATRAPGLPLSLPGPRCGPPRQVAAQPLRSLLPPLAALPCGPPLKGRLRGASSERERLPLRGAVSRRLTERCYRTESFWQGIGVCRGR